MDWVFVFFGWHLLFESSLHTCSSSGETGEEFGIDHVGFLTIPCNLASFEHLLLLVQIDEVLKHYDLISQAYVFSEVELDWCLITGFMCICWYIRSVIRAKVDWIEQLKLIIIYMVSSEQNSIGLNTVEFDYHTYFLNGRQEKNWWTAMDIEILSIVCLTPKPFVHKKICPPFVGLKIVNELIVICFYFRYMCMFISQDSLVRLWILLQCKL